MQVHIISCNDSLQGAIVDDGSIPAEEVMRRVDEKLASLKKAYFERNRHMWATTFSDDADVRATVESEAWTAYSRQCYWHINTMTAELLK